MSDDDKLMLYSQCEDLPNELFHQIQCYLTSTDFYKAFSNLNSRFERILTSINNLHFEIRSTAENQRLISASFASRITHISIPNKSDAAAIATVFSNVRSVTFYRAIRFIPATLPIVERIKLDLSNMRPKNGISLCSSIFSDEFPRLSSFHILHKKFSVVGHWKTLIYSIRHQSSTLTKFIFDVRPTIEWNMVEHFLAHMPHLQHLIIQTLNTRSRWTLSSIAQILKANVPHLNHLYIHITSLGTSTVIQETNDSHRIHPLFLYINSKKGNSRKIYSTTIISSRLN